MKLKTLMMVSLAVFLIQGISLSEAAGSYKVYGVSSSYKVNKTEGPQSYWLNQAISLYSAKGEKESFQIVVRPEPGNTIQVENVNAGDLTNYQANNRIGPEDISFNTVGYVTEYNMKKLGSQIAPDVLLDFGEFKEATYPDNYVIWVTVNIPKNIEAGTYVGYLTLNISGEEKKLILVQYVYDFEMAKEPSVWTQLFRVNEKSVKKQYGDGVDTEDYIGNEIYKGIFAPHRISPDSPVPKESMAPDGSDEQLLRNWLAYWNNQGLYAGNIKPHNDDILSKQNGAYSLDWGVIGEFYNHYLGAVKDMGFLDKCYIRLIIDEATTGDKLAINRDFAKGIYSFISPELKRHQTFGKKFYEEDYLVKYDGFIDIWSGVPGYLFSEKTKDTALSAGKFLNQQASEGKSITWYIHRNVRPFDKAWDLRSFFWQMMKHRVRATNHWCVNNWNTLPGVKFALKDKDTANLTDEKIESLTNKLRKANLIGNSRTKKISSITRDNQNQWTINITNSNPLIMQLEGEDLKVYNNSLNSADLMAVLQARWDNSKKTKLNITANRNVKETNDGFMLNKYRIGAIGDLIWPGGTKEDPKALSSIRLEIIRDGIEDYHYWDLFRTLVIELKEIHDKLDYKERACLYYVSGLVNDVYNTQPTEVSDSFMLHSGWSETEHERLRKSMGFAIEDMREILLNKR